MCLTNNTKQILKDYLACIISEEKKLELNRQQLVKNLIETKTDPRKCFKYVSVIFKIIEFSFIRRERYN
jgi:hypothetical protein